MFRIIHENGRPESVRGKIVLNGDELILTSGDDQESERCAKVKTKSLPDSDASEFDD